MKKWEENTKMYNSINDIIKSGVLTKLDSLTKYPSILTYHNLGQRGGMVNSLVEDKKFEGTVEITEKVDGSNFRVISWGDDYLIGKRDSIVYAKGDRIVNHTEVNTVLESCKKFLNDMDSSDNNLYVIYGEIYGDNINRGTKQYCGSEKKRGYRVFDVVILDNENLNKILSYDMERIVYMREHNEIKFLNTDELMEFCEKYDLLRTPIKGTFDASEIPTQVEETLNWMESHFTKSKVLFEKFGELSNMNPLYGRAEGIVIRTPDRSMIRKLRFEDYRKGKLKGWV